LSSFLSRLVRPGCDAILAAALVACGGGGEAEPGTPEGSAPIAAVTLTSSDIAVARETELTEGVTMSGSLEPSQTVVVEAEVAGRLRSISVDRGSRVGRGQVVAQIEAEGVVSQAASARAAVASAEASLALATQRLESARRLHAAGAISDIELRSSEAAHQAAAAQLAAAKAQSAFALEAEMRTSVEAPISGVVSSRSVEAGEAVSDGDQLLTVVDIGTLELEAQVSVDEAMRVRVGAPVVFTLDALSGETLRGRVARIDPRADPGTRQVGLAARLANPGGRIVAGQFARGRVVTGQTVNAVAVPIAAVSDSAGQARVFVIENDHLAVRAVTLGTRDEARGLIAVLSGLNGSERVLARPVVGAANGLRVTVASDTALSPPGPGGSR
jgi:RND family efflux transporter MFP subunit